MEDDMDRKEDDPDEEEIKRLCKIIRKSWDFKQRRSRSAYKINSFTVSVIKINDIDLESSY